MVKLAELNGATPGEFRRLLGAAFENSPWVAERSAAKRPFATREELHAAMCDTVQSAATEEKLALIRAHPDLVGRAVLTTESQSEQASAGLGNLTPDEVARFQEYNADYRDRFGFPFVICARVNKKDAILSAFPARLRNSPEKEIETALEEIYKIAELRLRDLVQ